MKLKTYRNYLLFNKLLDLMIYLILFTLITTFSFMVYYTTKSFIMLFLVMIVIYLIGLTIAKLFEIKILLPSICYALVSFILIFLITYYEQETINSDLIEFALILLVILTIISLIITVYKYETPTSVLYKLKDFFSGVSYGKKIKTKFYDNKNPNTITPYSTNLVFEKIKLLHKLEEEYNGEHNNLENNVIKKSYEFNTQNDLLKDYLSQLDKIEKRLSIKHSGAQDFELCNQKKNIKEVLKLQKEKVSALESEVKSLKNNLSELDDTFNKNKFYISNGYNIRYINYCNQIKEKLCLTDFKLDIVSFDLVIKNLEGEK